MTENYDDLRAPAEDPIRDAAEALAAEVADVMRLLGKIHGKLATNGFTEETRQKFVKMSKQLYRNMQTDLPHMYRPELVAAIEEDAAL